MYWNETLNDELHYLSRRLVAIACKHDNWRAALSLGINKSFQNNLRTTSPTAIFDGQAMMVMTDDVAEHYTFLV